MTELEQWLNGRGDIGSYEYLSNNGYLFRSHGYCPLVAVRGLLGITITFQGSNISADKVVCQQCFTEWATIHPWNDTPPTLKAPPLCFHLEAEANANEFFAYVSTWDKENSSYDPN